MQGFKTVKYKYRISKDGLDLMEVQSLLKPMLMNKHKAKKFNLYEEPTMGEYVIEIEAEEAL